MAWHIGDFQAMTQADRGRTRSILVWPAGLRQDRLQEQGPIKSPRPWCTGRLGQARAGGQEGRHLEVSVHDAQAVQVRDSTKDLADQVAGVLLRVGATLHDAVKQLTPCHPVGSRDSVDPGPSTPTHHPAPSLSLPSSQLHRQVEVGRALVYVLQSHDVGVADPAMARKSPYGGCSPHWAQALGVLPPTSAHFPATGQPFLGTQKRQGAPSQDTAACCRP